MGFLDSISDLRCRWVPDRPNLNNKTSNNSNISSFNSSSSNNRWRTGLRCCCSRGSRCLELFRILQGWRLVHISYEILIIIMNAPGPESRRQW